LRRAKALSCQGALGCVHTYARGINCRVANPTPAQLFLVIFFGSVVCVILFFFAQRIIQAAGAELRARQRGGPAASDMHPIAAWARIVCGFSIIILVLDTVGGLLYNAYLEYILFHPYIEIPALVAAAATIGLAAFAVSLLVIVGGAFARRLQPAEPIGAFPPDRTGSGR
jgi:hypothetical protein